jgi:hypothetical protein
MGLFKDIFNRVSQFIRPSKQDFAPSMSPLSPFRPSPEIGGKRTSTHTALINTSGVLPKKLKSDLSLDNALYAGATIESILDKFADSHPDVSFAVWNFTILANSGYTIKCKKLNNFKDDAKALKDLDLFIKRLSLPSVEGFQRSTSFDKVLIQLIQSAVIRGAVAFELVPTDDGSDISYIATVDPAEIDFIFENGRYIPTQDNQAINLDIPTFFFEGLHEKIDSPYGRSPLLGAINVLIFQLQVLNDLKAVVHNQGYPRLDIKIIEETLLKQMPREYMTNPGLKQQWLSTKMNEIMVAYEQLDPEATFFHYDSVEIGTAGGKGGGALIDPEKLMTVIDNLIMSGLKTLSTILGRRSTGNTESFAKLEIKLYMKGVEALQSIIEDAMSRALTLYLNYIGKQAYVEFKFNPIEIRTELEQEQMRQIQILNTVTLRDQGFITQDEASIKLTGNLPASQTPVINNTPTNADGNTPSGVQDTNPSAGGNTGGN